MPVQKLMFPRGCTACSLDRILAVSGVSVVNTSQLLQRVHFLLHFDILTSLYVQIPFTIFSGYFAMVIRPTLFSGLLRVLVWQTTLTASCWAWSLVGRKSPFRMYSLLSTLAKKEEEKKDRKKRKEKSCFNSTQQWHGRKEIIYVYAYGSLFGAAI